MYASSWATPTSESTTADVRPAVTKIFGQSPQGIVRYASASSVAYRTATEAASVAVNTPARIRSRMDRLATVPRMIIVIDGGMRIPVPDAAATIAADHAGR